MPDFEPPRSAKPAKLPRLIGQNLLEAGKLSLAQVEAVIRMQSLEHVRFGEAAVSLGFLSQADIDSVLAQQFDYQTAAPNELPSHSIHPSLTIAHAPHGAQAEAMRRCRSEILLRLGEQRRLVLAVISPSAGEGKSHVAASLAMAFAQLHLQTLLVDANMRRPRQQLLFDLNNQTGLSTMLAGRSEASLAATAQVMPDLRVLTAGPTPPNSTELLSDPRFDEMVFEMSAQVPILILDTPASNACADAQVVARRAGRALVVGRQDLSGISLLKKTVSDMQAANVQVLGSFYNSPAPRASFVNQLASLAFWRTVRT